MTAPTFRLTDAYLRTLGETAYLWGWPLANLHNRRPVMQQIPTPGLLMGIAPVAPPGRLCMLHDYVEPAERLVACPNQDVAYGLGLLSADLGPVVVQVPDFGDRFWVYQAVDQRSDSFVRLGAMYGTEPGHYVLAPTGWEGSPPDGILGEFRYDTSVGIIIPRVFMDDTDADRAAILPLVSQISMYPLDEYDGTMKSVDWTAVATFGDTTGSSQGDAETKWVDPVQFFDDLPTLLSEVPPRPGEEALYDWLTSLAAAAQADERVREQLVEAAKSADQGLVQELFEFRNIGLPSTDHWSTQRNGASFGTDYLARTAMAKANMFVNMPTETCYYYQDQDASGDRLDGTRRYCVTFPADALPPVRGFWSLTLYNEHHFFHPNELRRYSLGTKNKTLHHAQDGSLTLLAGGPAPTDPEELANWLPAPDGPFSLYLRAYWPDQSILDQTWTPPAVVAQ